MATATATPFDFSAVSVSEAPLPKAAHGRPRKNRENPFTEVLAKSYEDFTAEREPGRSITVPGKNAAEAVYLIRQASDDLGIGARVVTQHKGENVAVKDCKDIRGNVTVMFAAKDRRKAKDEGSEPAESENA